MPRLAHRSMLVVAVGAWLFAPQHLAAQATPNARGAASTPHVAAGEAAAPTAWRWARFSPLQYALTTAAAAGTFALRLAVDTPSASAWDGPVLFDGSARELLGIRSDAGRHAADVASTVLLSTLVAYSLADAFVLSWITTRSLDVATQLLLLDLQSFAITMLLTESSKHLIRRERASDLRCHLSRSGGAPCDQGHAHESFFSGHASLAFAAAGSICARHRAIALYGGGVADAAACGASLAVAAATGALRISADAHYSTDVVVGAVVGLATGYLMPTLLHFERPRAQQRLLVGAFWSGGPLVVAAARFP